MMYLFSSFDEGEGVPLQVGWSWEKVLSQVLRFGPPIALARWSGDPFPSLWLGPVGSGNLPVLLVPLLYVIVILLHFWLQVLQGRLCYGNQSAEQHIPCFTLLCGTLSFFAAFKPFLLHWTSPLAAMQQKNTSKLFSFILSLLSSPFFANALKVAPAVPTFGWPLRFSHFQPFSY